MSRGSRSGRKGKTGVIVTEAFVRADAAIDRAIRTIRATKAKFESKILHGPYGKQTLLQACYAGLVDLQRHRLVRLIRRRLTGQANGAGNDDEFVEALIRRALAGVGSDGGESGLNLFVNDERKVVLGGGPDYAKQLVNLKQLADAGAITEQEFSLLKADVLKRLS